MSASYNSNMGFQGKGFQSGDSVCNPIDEIEYYNTNYKLLIIVYISYFFHC